MSEDQEEKLSVEVAGTPNLLSAAMAASTPKDGDALAPGKRMLTQRQTVTVTILGSWCSVPALQAENFRLTLAELTYADEMAAAKSVAGDNTTTLSMEMAKLSMSKLNGEAINTINRNWVWDSIGMRGRQIVMLTFVREFSASAADVEAAMGNLEAGVM